MTIEQLEQGEELVKNIKKLEKFQNVFNSSRPYARKVSVRGDAGEPEILRVDDELHKLINSYVELRLKKMKKQFSDL